MTYYFNDSAGISPDWNELTNWWEDSGASSPAINVPSDVGSDIIVLQSYCSNIPPLTISNDGRLQSQNSSNFFQIININGATGNLEPNFSGTIGDLNISFSGTFIIEGNYVVTGTISSNANLVYQEFNSVDLSSATIQLAADISLALVMPLSVGYISGAGNNAIIANYPLICGNLYLPAGGIVYVSYSASLTINDIGSGSNIFIINTNNSANLTINGNGGYFQYSGNVGGLDIVGPSTHVGIGSMLLTVEGTTVVDGASFYQGNIKMGAFNIINSTFFNTHSTTFYNNSANTLPDNFYSSILVIEEGSTIHTSGNTSFSAICGNLQISGTINFNGLVILSGLLDVTSTGVINMNGNPLVLPATSTIAGTINNNGSLDLENMIAGTDVSLPSGETIYSFGGGFF